VCTYGEVEDTPPFWVYLISLIILMAVVPGILAVFRANCRKCRRVVQHLSKVLGHMAAFRLTIVFDTFYKAYMGHSHNFHKTYTLRGIEGTTIWHSDAQDTRGGKSTIDMGSNFTQDEQCKETPGMPGLMNCAVSAVTMENLSPLYWPTHWMFSQELGWLFAAFFSFLAIVMLFGLVDSICQKFALSTCIDDENEEAREAADDYLEMIEEVREDMISNPIGSIVAHITSWILTAAVVFCAQDSVGSQFGKATWQIWLTGFFLFLYLLLTFLTFANMMYYGISGLCDSSGGDTAFAQLDVNGDGNICNKELTVLLEQKPAIIRFIVGHLPNLNIGIAQWALGYFMKNGWRLVVFLALANKSMQNELLCHLGMTGHTRNWPETYALFSDIFEMTPLSPFGFMLCIWSMLVTTMVILRKWQEDRQANAAILLSLPLDEFKDFQSKAIQVHHSTAVKTGWVQNTLLLPAIGIAAALGAEVFLEALTLAVALSTVPEGSSKADALLRRAVVNFGLAFILQILRIVPLVCCNDSGEEDIEIGTGAGDSAKTPLLDPITKTATKIITIDHFAKEEEVDETAKGSENATPNNDGLSKDTSTDDVNSDGTKNDDEGDVSQES